MSTGWCKSKMSESLVRELEYMGLLQEQGVSQWRTGEEEDYPMEGTLETVMFRDFVERGLALPVSEFFYRLLQFWGIQLHHLTPQSILHLSIFTHFCEVLTFTNAPDLYTASARFVVAFPLEYSPKVYQSVDRQ